jgi:hypothetical protein
VIGVVFPLLEISIYVDVPVDIDIPVDVDIDIAVVPIDVVPDLAANGIGCTPGEAGRDCAANDIARWRRIVIRRVLRIRPFAVNHARIVIRHVDRIG